MNFISHKITFDEALAMIQSQSPGISSVSPDYVNDYRNNLQEKLEQGIIEEEKLLGYIKESVEFVNRLHNKMKK